MTDADQSSRECPTRSLAGHSPQRQDLPPNTTQTLTRWIEDLHTGHVASIGRVTERLLRLRAWIFSNPQHTASFDNKRLFAYLLGRIDIKSLTSKYKQTNRKRKRSKRKHRDPGIFQDLAPVSEKSIETG